MSYGGDWGNVPDSELARMEAEYATPPKTELDRAVRRRKTRDFAWVLKSTTTPPVRKQRTRWFIEAQDRRRRVAGWDV